MIVAKPYQIESVARVKAFGGVALLALSMGLGKSKIALDSTQELEAFPILVVCPASLKQNWEREAWKHIKTACLILEGRKAPKKLRTSAKIVIINYDILSSWVPTLLEFGFKTLILDEAHYIKNRRARRSKACKQLARQIPHRIALSGTPLLNRPAELWPILNVLRPDLYNSFFSFAVAHCAPKKTRFGWEYKGAENLDVLHKNMTDALMIRYRKEDVLQDLPPKQRIIVPIEISDRALYSKAFSDFVAFLRTNSEDKAAFRALRSVQLAKTNYLRRLAAQLKMPSVFEWIDNFLEESDGKLVVFAYHRKILDMLEDRYKKISVRIDGSTPKDKRLGIVDEFNGNPKVRLLIGQTEAAGVGLDMTAAHTVAFVELCWSPAIHLQAEDRVYGRLSDLHGATIYYLIASGTIEEDIVRLLYKKQRTSDACLDGIPAELGQSVFDSLINQLAEVA